MESSSYTQLSETWRASVCFMVPSHSESMFASWSLLYSLIVTLRLSRSAVSIAKVVTSCNNYFVFYPKSFESKLVVAQIMFFVSNVCDTQIKFSTSTPCQYDDSRLLCNK